MSTNADAAIKKITALPGVKAAFIFNQFQAVVARDIPGDYNEETFKRMAGQLYQLASVGKTNGVSIQELRLNYKQYALFLKPFAKQFYLVLFLDKQTDFTEFRQPLNLSLLILEKNFRGVSDQVEEGEVSKMATLAEQTLRAVVDDSESFTGMARRFCFNFLGKYGRDLIDAGIEDELLVVPLYTESDMQKLLNYIVSRVPHPLKQQILQEALNDSLRSSLKG